jgi:DNA-binding response OmpR family regulator
MSGNIDLGLIKKIGSKVQGAIVKPFTPKDLLKKLKPILRKAKS